MLATLMPRLICTDKSFYEGQGQPGQSSYREYGYDALGNVTRYAEGGQGVPEVVASIESPRVSRRLFGLS